MPECPRKADRGHFNKQISYRNMDMEMQHWSSRGHCWIQLIKAISKIMCCYTIEELDDMYFMYGGMHKENQQLLRGYTVHAEMDGGTMSSWSLDHLTLPGVIHTLTNSEFVNLCILFSLWQKLLKINFNLHNVNTSI